MLNFKENKMKKRVLVICIFILFFCVAENFSTVYAEDKINVVLARVGGDPFYKTVECAAIAKAKELDINLTVQSMLNFEIAEQTRVLDAITQTKPDVIVTAPVDDVGMIPAFKRIRDAGIKIVTYDTRLDDIELVDAEIITDNYQQGVMAADALANLVGEKGKVMILSDMPGIYTTGEEQRGFEETIVNYPDIEFLGTEYHNNDQNRGVQIVNAKLVSDPDLAGIFATNTFGSLAVKAALEESNKVGKVKVVAYDTPVEMIVGLQEGVYDVILAYEAYEEGTLAIEAAYALAKGEEVEPLQYVGNVLLDKDNVDDPELLYLRYVDTCE
jgi:ribose transport system substrate-binding protein